MELVRKIIVLLLLQKLLFKFWFSEVNKDILQSLPSTRQRHSLLTFGKSLLDLPDTDPRESNKRIVPDTGFGPAQSPKLSRTSSEGSIEALNLVKRDNSGFAIPNNQFKRTSSLLDLSDACSEVEREKFVKPTFSPTTLLRVTQRNKNSPTTQHLLRLRPIQQNQGSQRQLFKSPVDQVKNITLL